MIDKRNRKQELAFQRKVTFLCILALAVSMITGCNSGSRNQADKTPSAKHTQKPLESLEDSNANLGHWGRAMGSVLIAINDGNVYYFGGYEQTEGNRKAAARILEQSWKITDRATLLVQIQNLLAAGDRKEYRKEAREMKAMSKKQLRTALKQLSGDTLTHYTMVQYNWKKWKKKGLLAWDMCRVSHLVQWGYVAGYITVEEAQALIEPAAGKLAEKFDNWDDVQQNWLDGYALYAAIDAEHPAGTDYEVRQKKYEELKEIQKKGAELYDDSLFTTGVLPLPGVSADAILAELAGQEDPAEAKDPEVRTTKEPGEKETKEPGKTATKKPKQKAAEKPEETATKEPKQKVTEEPGKMATKEPKQKATEEPGENSRKR